MENLERVFIYKNDFTYFITVNHYIYNWIYLKVDKRTFTKTTKDALILYYEPKKKHVSLVSSKLHDCKTLMHDIIKQSILFLVKNDGF